MIMLAKNTRGFTPRPTARSQAFRIFRDGLVQLGYPREKAMMLPLPSLRVFAQSQPFRRGVDKTPRSAIGRWDVRHHRHTNEQVWDEIFTSAVEGESQSRQTLAVPSRFHRGTSRQSSCSIDRGRTRGPRMCFHVGACCFGQRTDYNLMDKSLPSRTPSGSLRMGSNFKKAYLFEIDGICCGCGKSLPPEFAGSTTRKIGCSFADACEAVRQVLPLIQLPC